MAKARNDSLSGLSKMSNGHRYVSSSASGAEDMEVGRNPETVLRFLFNMERFKSLYGICYNIASVLWLFFFFFATAHNEILTPQPGIKPTAPVLEGKVLTTGLPGKVPPKTLGLMVCLIKKK